MTILLIEIVPLKRAGEVFNTGEESKVTESLPVELDQSEEEQ